MVPPDSHGISRAPCYLGCRPGGAVVFGYGAVTVCGGPFAWPSPNAALCHSLPGRQTQLDDPTTPIAQRLPAITRDGFRLFRFRSPLLAESRLFSLPVGNEMFHFPTFPPLTLCVQVRVTGHDPCRVSPFGNPRVKARLAARRGLSQPPTSFIGSWCQGIHRTPLITWPQRCSRPLCSSQGTGGAGLIPPRALTKRAVRRRPVPRRRCDGLRHRPEPFPQDPTACRGRLRPSGHRSSPKAVLGAARTDAANWSAFHPEQSAPGRMPGTGPWTPARWPAPRCSLERR